jgi:predicted metalloprotease
MIKKMPKCFRLSASQKQYIESIKINGKLSGNEWSNFKNDIQMVALKELFKKEIAPIVETSTMFLAKIT